MKQETLLPIYNLKAPEGNVFQLITEIRKVDDTKSVEELFALPNYNEIVKVFKQTCGHKYVIVD